MSDAPKPCPFCGANESSEVFAERRDDGYTWEVTCDADECIAAGPVRATKREAIAAWNTRADFTSSVAARLKAADELEEAITNEREMVCQDMDMQAQVSKRLEEAITAYRATKEIPE